MMNPLPTSPALPSTSPDMGGQQPNSAAVMEPSKASEESHKGHRLLSCLACQRRKVKCDRENPCSTCVKSNVQCVYRGPMPRRRRAKKPIDATLRARLSRLESLLEAANASSAPANANQINPPELEQPGFAPARMMHNMEASRRRYAARRDMPDYSGKMVTEEGKTRYIENDLWNTLHRETLDLRDMLEEEIESEDDVDDEGHAPLDPASFFLKGQSPSQTASLAQYHPPTVQIFQLWQIFLENAHPLLKMIHAPTMQQVVLKAAANLEDASRGTHALMLAVYTLSVHSLKPAVCEQTFGIPKAKLFRHYQRATQNALIKAGLLKTSDLMVLQAFVLFLFASLQSLDARSLWSLSGLSVRIAQRLGVHRDGAQFKLSPFETEMRRRLWWRIIELEFRSAELCGSGLTYATSIGDAEQPLNIDDADLSPEMTSAPPERSGPTEMVYLNLKSNFFRFFHSKILPVVHSQPIGPIPLDALKSLMQMAEEHVMSVCDPSIPLHALTILSTREQVLGSKLRMARHNSQVKIQAPEDQRFTADLFESGLAALEIENQMRADPRLQHFMWRIDGTFQWHLFLHLLSEMRRRPLDPLAPRAWEQLNKFYQYRRELCSDACRRNTLHMTIASMTLDAWDARENGLRQVNPTAAPPMMPRCVAVLREQRRRMSASSTSGASTAPHGITSRSLSDLNTLAAVQTNDSSSGLTHTSSASSARTPATGTPSTTSIDGLGTVGSSNLFGSPKGTSLTSASLFDGLSPNMTLDASNDAISMPTTMTKGGLASSATAAPLPPSTGIAASTTSPATGALPPLPPMFSATADMNPAMDPNTWSEWDDLLQQYELTQGHDQDDSLLTDTNALMNL